MASFGLGCNYASEQSKGQSSGDLGFGPALLIKQRLARYEHLPSSSTDHRSKVPGIMGPLGGYTRLDATYDHDCPYHSRHNSPNHCKAPYMAAR